MGAVADKLTYLNVTKQKLKEVINATGGNLTNESTFRSYPNVLNQKILGAINGEIDLWNEYPKVTGEDTNLTLNTEEAKMSIIPEGNTSQDGTPTPDTPIPFKVVTGEQNVEIHRKNLFDKSNPNIINAYINASGKILSANNNKVVYIKCEPNTTYTIQKMVQTTTANNRFRIGTSNVLPNINVTLNNYINLGDGTTVTNYTYTTNSTANYLAIFIYYDTDISTFQAMLDSIQIEKGSSVTEYEPYQGQTYPLSLVNIELAKIGNYKDYIFKNELLSPHYNADLDLNGWYVCENIEKLILNGTENNWVNYGLTFYLNGNSPKTLNALCSHFIKQADVNWASSNPIYRGKFSMYNIANQIKFMPSDENITTLELWKEWLSNNNVKLIYGKETPTYEKITDTTLIQQLENLNNNARSYKGTTIIDCYSVSGDNENISVLLTALKPLDI